MLLAGVLVAAGCLAVPGDRILAGDLAAAVPAFSAVAAAEVVGYAPQPGARRLLSPGELQRAGRRLGIEVATPPQAICIERQTERLTEERVLAALRAAVSMEDAKIELLDFSRAPVPPGELEFPRSGVTAPPSAATPVLWRGRLRYDGNRSIPVWARVKMSRRGERAVAAESLPVGKLIEAGQVRIETADLFPFSGAPAPLESIVGRVPRRSIRAGAVIEPAALDAPRDIERGENVTVTVASGGAQLTLAARAETGGRAGDTVLLRNPDNGKRFPARVEGRGKVTIDVANHSDAARDRGARAGR